VEGAGVSGAEINGDGSGRPVRVSLDGGTVRADLLILADGSPAPVTRALGLVRAPAELVACRQYYVGDSGPMERLEIHFRADIAPGYCWVFPEGQGRANVGSGTFVRRARRGGISLRRVLTDFVRQGPDGRLAKAIPQGPLRGHLLRTRLQDTQTHAARVLVAGDAAGLVSPLTGEGISAALESGELAAAYALKALKAGDLSLTGLAGYSRTLSERYAMDQAAARWVRLALYAPGFVSRLFRRLASEPALALLVGLVIIGQESPRRLLRPSLMMRLLRSV
jgi:flavin-dependent dehydrogenase